MTVAGRTENTGEKLKVGVSSCLLGEEVRWDGGHRLDPFISGTLGKFFTYVPVCPEVDCGFPVPREAFNLEGDPRQPRLIATRTGKDFTGRMERWARQRVRELDGEELCGFIFKCNSPSCGMEGVQVRNEKGPPVMKGRGIFARILMENFPLLPVEDDARLHDMAIRENFIERIFTMRRLRRMLNESPSP